MRGVWGTFAWELGWSKDGERDLDLLVRVLPGLIVVVELQREQFLRDLSDGFFKLITHDFWRCGVLGSSGGSHDQVEDVTTKELALTWMTRDT